MVGEECVVVDDTFEIEVVIAITFLVDIIIMMEIASDNNK